MHKTRMKTLATAMLAASLLTGASATEYTWTGEGEDNSWSNPANWGGNGYPGNETDVANFGKTAPTIDLGNGDYTISTFDSSQSMSGVTVLENGRLVATTKFRLGYRGKTFGLQLNNAVVVDKAATAAVR